MKTLIDLRGADISMVQLGELDPGSFFYDSDQRLSLVTDDPGEVVCLDGRAYSLSEDCYVAAVRRVVINVNPT